MNELMPQSCYYYYEPVIIIIIIVIIQFYTTVGDRLTKTFTKDFCGVRITNTFKSTVCTILAKKHIIKKTQSAEGVTKITSAKQRRAIQDKMERLLLVWINEREMKRDVTSMPIIQEKAKEIFEKLKEQTPGSSSEELEFKATTGWFTKLKRKSGIKHVLMHGESASADKEAAEKYCLKFQEFIETEGYRLQQIFNCDETGLF
ncbi:tigger transposable element-derived protein 1-like protein [Trichonephila clavipes]|nr:tigger transposable element-derived protein 1-like protein [Trichonephila clavipes]